MQQARPMIRRLSTLGLPDGFRFRVNLPPRATERSWQDNPLDSLINGVDPTLITVDVTEAAVIDDLTAAAANLASLRVRGVRVCLDDFARGVSSLSLLRRLPLDEVRIDRTRRPSSRTTSGWRRRPARSCARSSAWFARSASQPRPTA